MKKVIIGIDLGGTNLRIGAVTSENEIKSPVVMRSAGIANAKVPIQELCLTVENYIKDNGIEEIEAISIGVPSSVANDKETVICTTNICDNTGRAVFSNMNIATSLKEMFKVPVFINNDVNNIMLYDVMANQLEEKKVIVGIYIGTGVGASVIIEGKVLEGKDGVALDLGHIPFFKGTIPCSCGKKGCCECYASGWKLQEIRKEYYMDTDIEEVFSLHGNDAPIREFVESCAHVYAVMATVFNPDVLIVGGGVIEMKDFPKEVFERIISENTGRDVMNYGFDYIYSKIYTGKGVIGAAIFARNQINQKASLLAFE